MADQTGTSLPSKSTDNSAMLSMHDHDFDSSESETHGPDFKMCKFCYSSDSDGTEWLHPCKCSGSLMWVHAQCFALWLDNAPPAQQNRCLMCNYTYQKKLMLLPPAEWKLPSLKISYFQAFEILLDVYSTSRLFRGFCNTFAGKRTIIMQLAHILFYRMFILTSSRIDYYEALGRQMLSSICKQTITNYGDKDDDVLSLWPSASTASFEVDALVRF